MKQLTDSGGREFFVNPEAIAAIFDCSEIREGVGEPLSSIYFIATDAIAYVKGTPAQIWEQLRK